MSRKFNFSAGPSTLPLEVLEKAAQGLVDFENGGVGIPEMSHRSKTIVDITQSARDSIRRLLQVPDRFDILFLQGGATLQFSMLAMNFLENNGDYISTGNWSEKAISEASTVGKVTTIASSKEDNFTYIPKSYEQSPDADYLHVTSNNTIFGTQFKSLPKPDCGKLIVDASSDIMSRPIDFTDIAMVYAGAQKNLGPSGVTVVIVDKELAAKELRPLPGILRYQTFIKADTMPNTPCTFGIYVLKLVLDWVEAQGGLTEIEKRNEEKAGLVYDQIDAGDFYTGTAKAEDRSLMNLTYVLPSDELTAAFLDACKAEGLDALKGYRTVGGIRASLYNAMPVEGAKALAELMKDFAQKNG